MFSHRSSVNDTPSNHRPAQAFEVQAVTPEYKRAFFDLIQEQAAQHASVVAHDQDDIDRLHNAVGKPQGTQAFLVVDSHTKKALAAVTYFRALGLRGNGLYLDDIVTTKAERGRGVGGFALSALAKIALNSGASHIALECASRNLPAQKFYDDLKGERFEDRHTWRKLGLLESAAQETTCRVRPMRAADATDAIALLMENGTDDSCQGLFDSIRHGDATTNPDFVLAVAENAAGKMIGAGMAYRSFSSFRVVSGLHIARLSMHEKSPEAAKALLNHFAKAQQDRDWRGHLDFTIQNNDTAFWQPILAPYAIEPLAYGADPMVVRCFSGAALEVLARKHESVPVDRAQVKDNNHASSLLLAPALV